MSVGSRSVGPGSVNSGDSASRFRRCVVDTWPPAGMQTETSAVAHDSHAAPRYMTTCAAAPVEWIECNTQHSAKRAGTPGVAVMAFRQRQGQSSRVLLTSAFPVSISTKGSPGGCCTTTDLFDIHPCQKAPHTAFLLVSTCGPLLSESLQFAGSSRLSNGAVCKEELWVSHTYEYFVATRRT